MASYNEFNIIELCGAYHPILENDKTLHLKPVASSINLREFYMVLQMELLFFPKE